MSKGKHLTGKAKDSSVNEFGGGAAQGRLSVLCECGGKREGGDLSSQNCIASEQTSNAGEIFLRDRLRLGDKLFCENVDSLGNV